MELLLTEFAFLMESMVPRKRLDEASVERLLQGATLLEQDAFGPKIYEVEGERMLKLFRRKRFWSSNLWSPYARRFARHSFLLKERGVPTVKCVQWGSIPHLERQYVLYEKLAGTPLRELEVLDPDLLGRFFAGLHDRGIYFRSCHLGNVLLLQDGERLGVIDILDIRFHERPLTDRERERNFWHLRRLPRDRERLDPIWKPLLAAYERGE